MHRDEVDIDASLVRALLARQFPRWADLEIAPVPSAGTDNALYRLGSDMVVRLPRIGWAAGDVAKEHHWLPQLEPLLPVTVPTPLTVGAPDLSYPWHWSVCPWLPGENPRVGSIDDPEGLAEAIAGFVTALRAIDPAGGPAASRGGPLAGRDDATRTAIEALGGEIDADAATAVWVEALAVPAWADPPTWIHGDLSPGNLLCVGRTLTSVIDFGGLGIGDPACDLSVAWNLLPASARPSFRTAVSMDDATWQRGRGWALSIALIQLPYYRESNPQLATNARHVIAEVLAERAAPFAGAPAPARCRLV